MISRTETFLPSENSALLPPHSPDAESAILGALLLDNSLWNGLSGLLTESDFYDHQNQLIFGAISYLTASGTPADAITVHNYLRRHGEAGNVEGPGTLLSLAPVGQDAGCLQYYVDIVRDCSIRRMLLEAFETISKTTLKPNGKTVNMILDEAAHAIFGIGEEDARVKPGFESMDSLMSQVLRRTQERADSPHDIPGIPTGFNELDRMTSGLQAGELLILAARPSIGSTALALNIAEHVALKEGLHVALFSMGTEPSKLASRLIGSVCRIEQDRLRCGKLSDDEWSRLSKQVERLQSAPLHIDGTPGLSSREICVNARRLCSQVEKLGLIVVDHLQLMGNADVGESNSESRIVEMEAAGRDLKMLASQLQCPVMALVHLDIDTETRSDRRPALGDLHESREFRALEHHADSVMFIYREDFHNPESSDPDIAEIIVAKQRNGPPGTAKLAFLKELARFESPELAASD